MQLLLDTNANVKAMMCCHNGGKPMHKANLQQERELKSSLMDYFSFISC